MSRFWIDPARSFVAMEWELGDMPYIVEELAQSPRGHWYPTRVRRKNAVRSADRATVLGDQIFHFFLDFDAELPDSLFEPTR